MSTRFVLLEMIVDALCDYFKKCKPNEYNLDTYTNELTEIRNYCNNILKDIAFTYSSIQYKFDVQFNFKTTEKEKKIKEDKKTKEIEDCQENVVLQIMK